ncbi:MAG: hypothetical protein GYA17_14145 [Chloroflexi bacterium]|nr:hypothetical protein [Anaerolineaceae bacterium]NMB89495.1 hypothetical protein [Chloroflexota bacterium]
MTDLAPTPRVRDYPLLDQAHALQGRPDNLRRRLAHQVPDPFPSRRENNM